LICEAPIRKALQHPLECWLGLHPNVASAIVWDTDPNTPGSSGWDNLDAAYRSDLEKRFDDYVAWYEGGMGPFASEWYDPMVNLLALKDTDAPVLEMSGETAWAVYRAYVAFSLAAQTHGWYGWDLTDDTEEDIQRVLLSYPYILQTTNPNGGTSTPGHYYTRQVTPSPPTVVFSFLKEQGLIRSTETETIGAVLGWMKGLSHMMGSLTTVNAFYHWGYRGPAPLSRILNGTHLTDPQYAGGTLADLHHWTPMCFGSTYFLEWMLRVLNIPVREEGNLCGHYAPHFPTVDRYLSHGDDPYDAVIRDDPGVLGEELLIDGATFADWFQGSSTTACDNVGRQSNEVALKHLTDYLVGLYCQDVAAGTLQNGQVMALYANWHTYNDLQTMGIWDGLKAKARAEGKCSP
jgi:hypothetical protein